MVENSSLVLIAICIAAITLMVSTPTMNGIPYQTNPTLAQEETEKSGDLTEPEGNTPFGGENAGSYNIGQDRYGLRIQVDMDDTPANGTIYVAWLVDNTTGNDLGIGQLVDDELAVTQKITNSSLYNLIEVTEQSPDTVGSSRNLSTVVAGTELDD
ncbi:MAG TPA: hypothetical protein VE378_04520 [Nitrososphaeraceae archaeon]|nr:hypothetical protein [Nitrososphaeraceae archaeon]